MELHQCPACEAFVRGDWNTCRACGHDLSTAANQPEAAEPTQPNHASDQGTQDDQWAGWAITAEPSAEPRRRAEWAPHETSWDAPTLDKPTPEALVATPDLVATKPATTTSTDSTSTPMTKPTPPGLLPARREITHEISNREEPPKADAALEPIMLSYNRGGFSGPLSNPRPVDSEVFSMPPNRVPTGISRTGVLALSAVGALTTLLILGLIGFAHTPTPNHNKLVSVGVTSSESIKPGLAGAIPAVTTSTVNPEWVNYKAPNGQFTIDFPTAPQVLPPSRTQPDKTVWQSASKDGQSQAIVSTQNAPSAGTADQILTGAIQADAQSLGATIASHSITTQNSRRQISAHMTTAKQSVDAIAFVQGTTLYTVMVVSNDANGDPNLFGRLSNTFTPAYK